MEDKPIVSVPKEKPEEFTVGLVQMSCGFDQQLNKEAGLKGIREAAAKGAQVICLQELFSTPYFCQTEDVKFFDLAESIPGDSTDVCAKLAKELGVIVIVPVFEKRASGLYHNSAVVIDENGLVLGIYRKNHIPDDPQYFEKFYFAPGDCGYCVFDTSVARIGVLICWDQWYPEAARLTALQGAEVIFYPSAIGWLPSERKTIGLAQHDAWRTIQRSHAIANGVYVAVANRVGMEVSSGNELDFWGQSFVCDPHGQMLVEASAIDEEVLVVRCQKNLIEEQRRSWPFLRDRRIDTYGPISSRFLENLVQPQLPDA